METYVVGGAVRDELLGLAVKDHDYVVTGATPEEMARLGYRPVGKDFPVFLHPVTQEEYALARTERKTAPGYRGFVFHTAPDVTLEQDLVRRDLTINAIAKAQDGTLYDPYGGRRDIEQRIFRHVSGAFREDPVRVLRLARFAARFTDFSVAPETMALMRQMVAEGEIDALVPERVWQELARGLMEARPSRMLGVLRECGALSRLVPELDAVWGAAPPARQADGGRHLLAAIDYAAARAVELPVRFACLMAALGNAPCGPAPELILRLCTRLKVPNDCRDLAVMTAREQDHIRRAPSLCPDAVVALFERCDAFRKRQRFQHLLQACECDFRAPATDGRGDQPFPQRALLQAELAAACAVDAGAIAQAQGADRQKIPQAIHRARAAAVGAVSGAAGAGHGL